MMRPLRLIAAVALLAACVREEPPQAPAPKPKPPEVAAPAPAQPPGRTRDARFSGSWYPGDPPALRAAVAPALADPATPDPGVPVVGLVAPHAGLRYSGATAAVAYAALRRQPVRRFVVLGPTHRVPFEGVALPAADVRAYATPIGEVAIDHDAVEALRGAPGFDGPALAHAPEHSLEMQAIFLEAVRPDALLLPLVVGRVGSAERARELASSLRPLLRPGDVVVASSDFTHFGPRYGYEPFKNDVPAGLGRLLDGASTPLLAADATGFDRHLQTTGDTICGREPVRLLLALLPRGVVAERVASETSGRLTGDYRNSVSYLSLVYRRKGGWPAAEEGSSRAPAPPAIILGDADQELALRAVRKTLEVYLTSGKTLEARDLGLPLRDTWTETLGTFVTLKKNGRLRGCIGHTMPVQALWRDIRDNAISAAVRDRRFPPVGAGELGGLHIEISILTRPKPAAGPQEFVVGRHGVILSARGRGAVYLPQVAPEQGWDTETTLAHLARKAGLPLDGWRGPGAQLSLFEAQVFGEHE